MGVVVLVCEVVCFLVSDNIVLTLFVAEFCRYDLNSGVVERIGNHQNIANCIGYSDETCELSILSSSCLHCNLHKLSIFVPNLRCNDN